MGGTGNFSQWKKIIMTVQSTVASFNRAMLWLQ